MNNMDDDSCFKIDNKKSLFVTDRPLGLPIHDVMCKEDIEIKIKHLRKEKNIMTNEETIRYGRIIDLAKCIGIKPTKKFARRLKRNRHAEDPKFVTLPSHKRYKKMLKQIKKRMLRDISIPLPRLDTPAQDGIHRGSLMFAGLPVLSPELSNKKYFIGVDVADAGGDKSSETIIDTHTGKIVEKEVLNG